MLPAADPSLPERCLAALERAEGWLTSIDVFTQVEAETITDVCRALHQLHARRAVLRELGSNGDGTRYRYTVNRGEAWLGELDAVADELGEPTPAPPAPAVGAAAPPPESFARAPPDAPRRTALPRRYPNELKRRVLQRLAQVVAHDIAVVLLDIERDLRGPALGK